MNFARSVFDVLGSPQPSEYSDILVLTNSNYSLSPPASLIQLLYSGQLTGALQSGRVSDGVESRSLQRVYAVLL